jgi:hypothetical protein
MSSRVFLSSPSSAGSGRPGRGYLEIFGFQSPRAEFRYGAEDFVKFDSLLNIWLNGTVSSFW